MNRLLAKHPRRVQRAVVVFDCLRETEAQRGVPLVERLHVVGDKVDVVEAIDAGTVAQVVALMMMTGPLDLVEVLDDESERILDSHGGSDAACRAGGIATNLAPSVGVEQCSGIEILWCSHSESESRARRLRTLAQDEAVVNELFVTAEVHRFVVFGTDDEAQSIDPEMLAGGEVRDDQLGVRRANNVGGSRCGHRHDRTPQGGLACGEANTSSPGGPRCQLEPEKSS